MCCFDSELTEVTSGRETTRNDNMEDSISPKGVFYDVEYIYFNLNDAYDLKLCNNNNPQ